MRKLLLLIIGTIGLLAVQAQTKYITGRIYDASPSGKQVTYQYYALDTMGILADSGSGVWTSSASGLIQETLTIGSPYKYGMITFSTTDCNGQALSTRDSFSNGVWSDSLHFDFYLCDQPRVNLTGAFFKMPGYNPVKNAMIYIYVDSSYATTPTLALIDSVATDSLGAYNHTSYPATYMEGRNYMDCIRMHGWPSAETI